MRQAAFIGVGAMVGAGIFSLLGAAGEVAGAAVWVSFLIAGAIVLAAGFDLSSIASIGSAVALLVFTVVTAAHFRVRAETGASTLVLGVATRARSWCC